MAASLVGLTAELKVKMMDCLMATSLVELTVKMKAAQLGEQMDEMKVSLMEC